MTKPSRAKGRAKPPDRQSLSHQLRAIVESRLAGGDSVYSIEAEAEIPRGGVARFLSGERSLTLPTVDRLARSLGLRLVEVEVRKGKRRPRPLPEPGPTPTAGLAAESSPDT